MPREANYLKKLLFILSLDSRAKRKDLSSKLKISPQLLSYSILKLESDKSIQNYETVIDPARFGLTTLRVLIAYTNFDRSKQKEIMKAFLESDYVTLIEEASLGIDLIVEYTVPNLSFFNKLNSEFLENFRNDVELISVYPVIVKHKFPRNYIYKKIKVISEDIICGDRESVTLNPAQKMILKELMQNPLSTYLSLSQKAGIDVRTTIKIVALLQKKNVIRGFGTNLNFHNLGINSCTLMINIKSMSLESINKMINYCKTVPEITQLTKLIGNYSLMVKIETFGNYTVVVDSLRKEFGFYDYHMYEIRSVLKNTYIPFTFIE